MAIFFVEMILCYLMPFEDEFSKFFVKNFFLHQFSLIHLNEGLLVGKENPRATLIFQRKSSKNLFA